MSNADVPSLASGLGSLHVNDPIDNILENILLAAGFEPDAPLSNGWSSRTQAGFDAVLSFYLDDYLAGGDQQRFVASANNAFFIDAWRSLCKRMGISVRFVYIRNFSNLYRATSDAPITAADFDVALAMARQAGPDVACFDMVDWEESAETANHAFASVFNGALNQVQLPAAQLVSILRAVPRLIRTDLPVEIEALHHLYEGKHYGLPLLLPADSTWLEMVEGAAHPKSALSLWLSLMDSQGPRLPELSAALASPGSSVLVDRSAMLSAACDNALQPLRRELVELKLKIKEYEAAPGNKAQRNKAPGNKAPGNKAQPNKVQGKQSAPDIRNAGLSRSARLWRKFKNDPAQYCADSKFSLVRSLGRVVLRH